MYSASDSLYVIAGEDAKYLNSGAVASGTAYGACILAKR